MTDGRVPIVAGLLSDLPIPDWYWVDLDAVAGSLVAACDEWDSRPCPEVEAIVGPLTRQLSAREDALGRMVEAYDAMADTTYSQRMYGKNGTVASLNRAAFDVIEAHRAVKGDQ